MKDDIVEPEKSSVAKQCHLKHVKTVKNSHATTDELLEAVFSMLSMLIIYKRTNSSSPSCGGNY
jgi:hypothetical protein